MDENFVICPFNKSHIISRLRIQYHLVKCKKSYPNSKKIVCPYDASEYINPDNFMTHISVCKKSRKLDVTDEYKQQQFEKIQHGCVKSHPFQMPSHIAITDEWNNSIDSSDDELTVDEENANKIRIESSKAVRSAFNYLPNVIKPIGRGKFTEIFCKYLNKYESSPDPVDHFSPIPLSSNNMINEKDITTDYTDKCESDSEERFVDADHNSIISDIENHANSFGKTITHSLSNLSIRSKSNDNASVPSIDRANGNRLSFGRGILPYKERSLDKRN